MKKPLIILTGPTAVGKTALSISLAKLVGGEIISADSVQVYKEMDIGSAKIKKEEMDGVNHHLIDVLPPSEKFDAFKFKTMALRAMDEIYKRGHIPIIEGGTGFYIDALLYDAEFTETKVDYGYRESLEKLDKSVLHKMLEGVDKESADSIHENNKQRVIRALEYCKSTGEMFSLHNKREKEKKSPYNFAYFVLTMDRDRLYARINDRVDIMMNEGLVDEVKDLLSSGIERDAGSMNAIGYKEIASYVLGETPLDEAVRLLKRNTRHFAKRQLTWFRRNKDVIKVNKDMYHSEEEILLEIKKILKEKEIIS